MAQNQCDYLCPILHEDLPILQDRLFQSQLSPKAFQNLHLLGKELTVCSIVPVREGDFL
jgi:hypothetical protein